METLSIELCERGWIPDPLVRVGMRRLIAWRLAESKANDEQTQQGFMERIASGPIAEHTMDANEQHYEVPASFFKLVLGKHLKYSGCLFEAGTDTLDGAEEAMLASYAERAGLRDGQRILDLGCGWGSFSLWVAQRYPNSALLAVSNSNGQREHIEARARQLDLHNLTVQTCDINTFDPGESVFDRVVSIEMFEHMRNYRELLARIRRWLTDDGRLFVHIFCHRQFAYPFTNEDDYDWMARHFFTGGIMPSEGLLSNFSEDLSVRNHWWVPGGHYQATANAWLHAMDTNRPAIRTLFVDTYGRAHANRWVQRWRMFFMAVAELFGYDEGRQWGVGHYLMEPKK